MRILQFETVDKGWGGTEIHVIRLTDGLLRHGHTVGVVAAEDSLILKECEKLGAETIPFHLRRRGEWRKFLPLVSLIRSFQPDVVHCHTPVDLGLVSLAAWVLRVPCRVCTRHGIPRFSNARSARMYSRLFHRFIAVSEFARRVNVLEYGLPANQVVTIYPGLDPAQFPFEPPEKNPLPNPPPEGEGTGSGDGLNPSPTDGSESASIDNQGLSPTPPPQVEGGISERRVSPGMRVGLVGRMSEEKGHALFLQALARASGIVGVFIGDGPLRSGLESLASSLGIAERVEWAGSQADVRPWIAGCDAVCVPSVKDEAMPWVLLEAMACGRPVIVSTTGGLPEVVTEGFGIVFEVSTPAPSSILEKNPFPSPSPGREGIGSGALLNPCPAGGGAVVGVAEADSHTEPVTDPPTDLAPTLTLPRADQQLDVETRDFAGGGNEDPLPNPPPGGEGPALERRVSLGSDGANALADALTQLASDFARREAMGRRARQVLEERFSLERMAAETEALYELVLGTMKR